MEFKPAKCPNCGGELKVPPDKKILKCMYCGSDIVVKEAIAKANDINTESLIELINTALNSKNFQEAVEFCNKILERDSNNVEALLKKGLAVGLLDRPKEALNYFLKLPELGCPPDLVKGAQNVIASSYIEKGENFLSKGQNLYKVREQEAWSYSEESRSDYRREAESEVVSIFREAYTYFDYALVFVWDNRKLLILKRKCEVLNEIRNLRYYQWQDFDLEKEYLEIMEMIHDEEVDYEPDSSTIRKRAFSGTWQGCFIATAAYNNPLAEEVILLRKYRDSYLERKKWGKWFIEKYYKHSPEISKWISKTDERRFITRLLLSFIIKLIKD